MHVRPAAVAGSFYPSDPDELRSVLGRLIFRDENPVAVIGMVAPHAGYVYSGGVAGKAYGFVRIPSRVIVLCPNHHGTGAPIAVSNAHGWETPLGIVPVDRELVDRLVSQDPGFIVGDDRAHAMEHSLEVHLPFLQYLRPDVSILPLSLGFGDVATATRLGGILARVVSSYEERPLVVASSDMTHYESADSARAKDQLAIERFCAFDPAGLIEVCRRHRITMCGVVPAAVMLETGRRLGARRAELIAYSTSGDVTGDWRQVVAYAAMIVH